MTIHKCKDLEIYNVSFASAMEIFQETRKFPREELYSLVDQIRRSSRSVPANIREGFAKRRYPEVFARHLNDALGSSEETLTWLEFAYQCAYLPKKNFEELSEQYERAGAMIFKLMRNWRSFDSSDNRE